MHVLPHLPHASAVLLDQTNHKAAAGLSIVRVIVLLIQLDHKLRVRPKRVCGYKSKRQSQTDCGDGGGVMAIPPVQHTVMTGPALCLTGSLTGIVPAASGGGSSPPAAIELGQSPLRDGLVAQGVRGQVTDL